MINKQTESMQLSSILFSAAKLWPDNTAVLCKGKRFTYKELYGRTQKLALALSQLGIKQKDKIAIVHKNEHHYLETYYATVSIGAVLVPVNYRLTATDISYILENSEAELVITSESFTGTVLEAVKDLPRIKSIVVTDRGDSKDNIYSYEKLIESNKGKESALQESNINNAAQIYYTSGTTGKPKGVILTHRNNYSHALKVVEELHLSKADNWLHVSPMFHLADAWAVWAITMAGGTHTFVSDFEPGPVLELIEKEKVSLSNFIPTLLTLLVNYSEVRRFEYKSIRMILSGGAPIAPEIVRQVMEIFRCEFVQTYGMTETSPFLTMSILKPHLRKLSPAEQFPYIITTGKPFSDVQLKVINDAGEEVKRDDTEVGEIVVKGETITPGYWKNKIETENRIREGWLYTGDLATVNKEGYLTIADRKNDMIITGGENVYSIEVENVLYGHPAVLETAVVGIPDDVWGEKITAAVVRKPEAQPSQKEIIEYCRKNLAGFKCPKAVIFLDTLPKTDSGKISKQILRKLLLSD